MENIEFTRSDFIKFIQNQFITDLPLSSLYAKFNFNNGNFRLLPIKVKYLGLEFGIEEGSSVEIATQEIIQYLKESIYNQVIIEYSSAKKGYSWLEKKQIKYQNYGNYVYSIFNNSVLSIEEIEKSVRFANSYELHIGLFQSNTLMNYQTGSEISEKDLHEICDLTQKILFGVFDGQGILIWER